MTTRSPMIFDSTLGIFRKAGEDDEMLSKGGYSLGNDASDIVTITSSGTLLTAVGALTLRDNLVVSGTGNITGNTTIDGNLTTGGVGYSIQFTTTSGNIGVSNDMDLIQLDGTTGVTINGGLTSIGDATVGGTGYSIQFAATSGDIGVSNDTDLIQLDGTNGVTINGDTTVGGTLVVVSDFTPASSSSTGVSGTIAWDSSYLYVCIATNTWKRTALTSW